MAGEETRALGPGEEGGEPANGEGEAGLGDFDQGWEMSCGGFGGHDEAVETEFDEVVEAGPGACGEEALEEKQR